jgi:hypothetical protein
VSSGMPWVVGVLMMRDELATVLGVDVRSEIAPSPSIKPLPVQRPYPATIGHASGLFFVPWALTRETPARNPRQGLVLVEAAGQ